MQKDDTSLLVDNALSVLAAKKQQAEAAVAPAKKIVPAISNDLPDLLGPNEKPDRTTPYGVRVVRLADAERALDKKSLSELAAPPQIVTPISDPSLAHPVPERLLEPEPVPESIVPSNVSVTSKPPVSASSDDLFANGTPVDSRISAVHLAPVSIVPAREPWILRWMRRLMRWLFRRD